MAKLNVPAGVSITRQDVLKVRRRVTLRQSNEQIIVSKWPKLRGPKKTPLQQAWVNRFSCMAKAFSSPEPNTRDAAEYWAKTIDFGSAGPMTGSGWFYRDVIVRAATGQLITYQDEVRVRTPTVSVTRLTAQAVAAATDTVLVPEAFDWDTNSFWSPTINPGRLTVKAPGLYLVGAIVQRNTGGTSRQYAYIRHTSGRTIAISMIDGVSAPSWATISGIFYFQQNEYIELLCRLQTGASTWRIEAFWMVAITPEALIP